MRGGRGSTMRTVSHRPLVVFGAGGEGDQRQRGQLVRIDAPPNCSPGQSSWRGAHSGRPRGKFGQAHEQWRHTSCDRSPGGAQRGGARLAERWASVNPITARGTTPLQSALGATKFSLPVVRFLTYMCVCYTGGENAHSINSRARVTLESSKCIPTCIINIRIYKCRHARTHTHTHNHIQTKNTHRRTQR